MFMFFWVSLRLTLIFGTIFILPLFLVMRAMAQKVREERRPNLACNGGGLSNHHAVGAAITIFLVLGVRRHEWIAAMMGCGFVCGILGFIRLDRAQEGALLRRVLAWFERGPASEDLWVGAAAPVGIILLLDTFMTGEWRFSLGLAVALVWCLVWGFLTRHFRPRDEPKSKTPGHF